MAYLKQKRHFYNHKIISLKFCSFVTFLGHYTIKPFDALCKFIAMSNPMKFPLLVSGLGFNCGFFLDRCGTRPAICVWTRYKKTRRPRLTWGCTAVRTEPVQTRYGRGSLIKIKLILLYVRFYLHFNEFTIVKMHIVHIWEMLSAEQSSSRIKNSWTRCLWQWVSRFIIDYHSFQSWLYWILA